MLKFYCQKTDKRSSYQKIGKCEHWTTVAKVVNNWFDRMQMMTDFKICCLYVVLGF